MSDANCAQNKTKAVLSDKQILETYAILGLDAEEKRNKYIQMGNTEKKQSDAKDIFLSGTTLDNRGVKG